MKHISTFLSLLMTGHALAATGTFIAPDGSVICQLGSVQVTAAGNATMTVTGCEAFSCDTPSPPPPPPPPPSVTGDPGTGVWHPNTATTVFDLSKTSNRTFVPGCIDGQDWRSGCPYNSGMRHGEAYGARIKLTVNSARFLKIDRAEAGEDSAAVRGAVSAVPGALSATDPKCVFNPLNPFVELQDTEYAQASKIVIPGLDIDFSTACVVPANTPLYLNFTPDEQRCGSGFTCRVQVIER